MTEQDARWERVDGVLVAEVADYSFATIEETRNGVVLVIERASGRSSLAVFDTVRDAQAAAAFLADA